jgi:hypothetical protein
MRNQDNKQGFPCISIKITESGITLRRFLLSLFLYIEAAGWKIVNRNTDIWNKKIERVSERKDIFSLIELVYVCVL